VNKALRRVSFAVLLMFVLLLINVNYLQGFQTASLATRPNNTRTFYNQFQVQRGRILTVDNKVIAESKASGDAFKFTRVYPFGNTYAPVTGVDTIDGTGGATGIEDAENTLLSGSSSSLAVRNIIDLVTGKQKKGADVQLTINSAAQTAAYTQLKQRVAAGQVGAVVALNPQTGAILAMASYPTYNPNTLTTHDGTQLNNADNALLKSQSNPLLNRAINDTFPPGSTFKIVTSSSYFTKTNNTPQTLVDAPQTLKLPGSTATLINFDGEACGDASGKATVITAFTQSCNTVFGNLGMQLGSVPLKQQADAFSMNNSNLKIPMTVSPSIFPKIATIDKPSIAQSAVGQFDDTVTPLQEAMFSAAIANGGKLMTPYLVQQVTAADLSIVQQTTPTQLSQPVSANVANEVNQMMLSVVQSPNGTAHLYDKQATGVLIAGKTGTAQTGINNTGLDDAVFTAFAPADNPKIAVGVIVKGGGQGADAAAPIAVAVIKAYLAAVGG
jgi:peptidoglycan glycosyltransferase